MAEYVYRGDRWTAPELRGARCSAVRRGDGRCIRGKNGSMLVRFEDGRQHVVLGRQLRRVKATATSELAVDVAALPLLPDVEPVGVKRLDDLALGAFLNLNCPYCGRRLVYVRTERQIEFYRCDRDGTIILPPDGRARRDDPENPATRH